MPMVSDLNNTIIYIGSNPSGSITTKHTFAMRPLKTDQFEHLHNVIRSFVVCLLKLSTDDVLMHSAMALFGQPSATDDKSLW